MLAATMTTPAEPRITSEQAKALARKSVESRKLKSQRAKEYASTAGQNHSYTDFVISMTARTQMMLFRLCWFFDSSKKVCDLDALTRAMERLFGIWAHLTQTPAPGQLRPEKMKKLLRDYGMKSALDKMLAQPSIVMSEDATKETTPYNTQILVTNKDERLSLTPDLAPLNTNQNSPLEPPQTEPPRSLDDVTLDEGPEPDATTFVKEKESLNSTPDPSPPSTPPPPEVEE